jgi:hypothetical protein
MDGEVQGGRLCTGRNVVVWVTHTNLMVCWRCWDHHSGLRGCLSPKKPLAWVAAQSLR